MLITANDLQKLPKSSQVVSCITCWYEYRDTNIDRGANLVSCHLDAFQLDASHLAGAIRFELPLESFVT